MRFLSRSAELTSRLQHWRHCLETLNRLLFLSSLLPFVMSTGIYIVSTSVNLVRTYVTFFSWSCVRYSCQEIWLQGCRVLFSWWNYIITHRCYNWCSIWRNCRNFKINVFVVAATARPWRLFAFSRSRGLALLTFALVNAWSIGWIPSSPVPCRRLLLPWLERLTRHICVVSAWLDLNVTYGGDWLVV